MSKRCVRCGSRTVRRSSFHGQGDREQHVLHSPYRCEVCGERFWVVSRKARNMMALILAVLVLVVLGVVIDWRFPAELPQRPAPQESAGGAPRVPPLTVS